MNSKTHVQAARRSAGMLSVETRYQVKRLRYLSHLKSMGTDRWPRHVFEESSAECQPAIKSSWRYKIEAIVNGDAKLLESFDGADEVDDDMLAGSDNRVAERRTAIKSWAARLDSTSLLASTRGIRGHLGLIARTLEVDRFAPLPAARLAHLRPNDTRIKMMCGTAATNDFLCRMQRKGRSKFCPHITCANKAETVEHILLHCEAGSSTRDLLIAGLGESCSHPTDEGSCLDFYQSLDSQGKICFLLGGPVDGRSIEPPVDQVLQNFVDQVWEGRKVALTKSLEESHQLTSASSDDDEPSSQKLDSFESLWSDHHDDGPPVVNSNDTSVVISENSDSVSYELDGFIDYDDEDEMCDECEVREEKVISLAPKRKCVQSNLDAFLISPLNVPPIVSNNNNISASRVLTMHASIQRPPVLAGVGSTCSKNTLSI